MAKRENFRLPTPKIAMATEPNAVELAVARALRDNLERIQRTSDELNQAVNDVVAACSSSRPSNALPPMLRAQSAAASLAAALEVLTRFTALALQPGPRSPLEEQITRAIGSAVPEPAALQAPPPAPVVESKPVEAPPVAQSPESYEMEVESLPSASEAEVAEAPIPASAEFDVSRLTSEEQELHRRANRVAKVSMQDIKMLRPDQVKLGREQKDICIRLKDDIEKAHREYERRFRSIMDHPVDYFHQWLVDILAGGDESALGEYPYTPAGKAR